VPLHEGDAHPVYIDFISDTQTVTILRNNLSEVDGLHQISADTVTPLMNIKEACQKLEGISNADTVCTSPLSNVAVGYSAIVQKSILVEDFKEHIVPVFTKIDTQKEEIDNLWGLIRQLQQENMEILQHNSGPWRAEVMRSKMAAHIQKEENNELRDALRELRRDKTALQNRLKGMGLLQAEVGRWKRAVDVQKEENGILQTELRRLQRAEELLRGKVKKMGPLQDDVERLKTALLNRANLNITKWKERVTELEQKNALYEDVLKKYAVCPPKLLFIDHNLR